MFSGAGMVIADLPIPERAKLIEVPERVAKLVRRAIRESDTPVGTVGRSSRSSFRKPTGSVPTRWPSESGAASSPRSPSGRREDAR